MGTAVDALNLGLSTSKSYFTGGGKCWRGCCHNWLQTSSWEPLSWFLWPGSGPLLLGIVQLQAGLDYLPQEQSHRGP